MRADYPLFLIPLLPLLGAMFSLLIGRRAGKNIVTLVTVGSVAAAALVAFRAVFLLARDLPPGGQLTDAFFSGPWMKAGDLEISAGLVMDHLSAVLCLVVTGIGLLIHIYATAYMEHDDHYTRFFAYLNLFTGAMLILVLGDSMPVTFVGWEGVGLCSYLLIGFWNDKEANATAGRKAFVVNRIGDFGFLLAIFLIFTTAGTLKYDELPRHLDQFRQITWFGWPVAYFVGILILVGAAGKSAQIPLFVWLPDAMAGPTPVSALIHAATMVTAGVYVISRVHFLFEIAPAALGTVAAIGAATAFFAATIGFAQRDLKKVLAYSTISQLGFMFVGVGSYVEGTSNYQAGVFHLVTHAFFKAGLFLGAGSVMHAMHNEGDIMRMGGLKKYLPHTRWTFLIYCLAIAGIPPFAGFWSKDMILGGTLAAAWPLSPHPSATEIWFAANGGKLIYGVMLLAAACTSFYMFRLYFLVFEGKFRGTHEEEHHLHESPPAMTIVLWILAAGSILVGLLGIPDSILHGGDRFGAWLAPVLPPLAHEEDAHHFYLLAGVATGVSLLSIGLAWLLYKDGPQRARNLVSKIQPIYKLVFNKYYVDELYDVVIVRPLRAISIVLWKAVDTFVIDMVMVNGTAFVIGGLGRVAKSFQNGDLQRYIVGVALGTAGIVFVAIHYPAWSASRALVVESSEGHVVSLKPPAQVQGQRRMNYAVDWDRSGTFEPVSAATGGLSHRFDSAKGASTITVRATDPLWGTDASYTYGVVVP